MMLGNRIESIGQFSQKKVRNDQTIWAETLHWVIF